MFRHSASTAPLFLALPAFLLAQVVGDRPLSSLEELEEARDATLYSNCEPVNASVLVALSGLGRDAEKAIEDFLDSKVEDAFRTAGIRADAKRLGPILSVGAWQGSTPEGPLDAVYLHVRFIKPAVDDYGARFLATAWVGLETAVPPEDATLLVNLFVQSIDQFVIKYLKVNANACPYAE